MKTITGIVTKALFGIGATAFLAAGASVLLDNTGLLPAAVRRAAAEESSPVPAIVGTWDSIDRHVAIGSLYQPVHGVRKREGVVHFQQDGERLTGFAVHADHAAITHQERWKDSRTKFRNVTFEGDRLMFEFEIGEWRKEAGPLAVEEGRLENKVTIRVEAVLKDDRLTGTWKMFLADGTEVFRGEWEATRAKEAPASPVDQQSAPDPKSPPPPAAQPASSTAPTITSALVRADAAVPTRGPWGHWLRYFRGSTRDTDDMVVLAVTLKPGQEPHPPHKHIEEEFLILSEGRGIWHLDGREFPAQAGDVLFAAPDTMHGIRNTGDAPLTYYMLKWNSKSVAVSGQSARDQSTERAMIVSGWALADHSSLQPDEIIARENKRGLWRGTFVNPIEWSAGKWLLGEK